jgi:pantetheine-phosphate adenylyltransferase
MLYVVGVAGTFGPLHKGHKALLQKAFEVGKKVLIALTTEEMLKNKEVRDKIPDYELRKLALERYLDAEGYHGRYEIIPLNDPLRLIKPRVTLRNAAFCRRIYSQLIAGQC